MIVHGDCVALMAELPDGCVDAIVTDPPYQLAFMGKAWDHVPTPAEGQAMHKRWADEALRILKPGGHLLAFGGTRTYHRLACAIEDAGFEIRDCLAWLYGSGFPKSLDVSKAIDKARGDDCLHVTAYLREQRGGRGLVEIARALGFPATEGTHGTAAFFSDDPRLARVPTMSQWEALRVLFGFGADMDSEVARLNARKGEPSDDWKSRPVLNAEPPGMRASWTEGRGWNGNHARGGDPVRAEAEQWQGWGTALKPAHEPIVMARKPLAGTVAQNVLEHGTGALNVDGCRVEGEPRTTHADGSRHTGHIGYNGGGVPVEQIVPSGRWPANVVLDEQAAAMLDEQTGELGFSEKGSRTRNHDFEGWGHTTSSEVMGYGDSGGASRFLYVAKSSSAERSAGLDGKVCGCTSQLRATYEATEEGDSCSPTFGSGSKLTDPSLPDTRSTTETETRPITTSGTSNSSRLPNTSGSIPPTTDGTRPASGSDAATSAVDGSRQTQSTTTSAERDGLSTVGVDPAISQESLPTSSSAVCADCGEVIKGGRRNVHPLEPTVKPIELMRWLVRLVTPPGGTVLDPFTGSGTTGCAAVLEGLNFVGMEREAEYVKIAEARIEWWSRHPDGLEIVKALEAERERKAHRDSGQLDLLS